MSTTKPTPKNQPQTLTAQDVMRAMTTPTRTDGTQSHPILQEALYGLVTTSHADHIGVTLEGYATRYMERDAQGQRVTRQALAFLDNEYFSDIQPKVFYDHGRDSVIGWRPVGWCLDHRVDETGLWVSVFVPRDPDTRVFPGPFRAFSDVLFSALVDGRLNGLSIGGNWLLTGDDITLVHLSEISLCVNPAVTSARAAIKLPDVSQIAQAIALAERAAQSLT